MINFVRKPSETPNVRNIDDIVPFRYAYGDQNGFVKDKGNELSYTINGSNFRINSGRIVLFGVESDIDANGVTITIPSVATTTYYSIYYKVNMATNTTSIESESSEEDYPEIPIGDDLTANTSGTANLVLYTFTATNGVISNVNKVVQRIEYINKKTKVNNSFESDHSLESDNSLKINDLEIKRNSAGILKIGDVIVPQKKLLWSGSVNIGSTTDVDIDTTQSYSNKTLEFVFVDNKDHPTLETTRFLKLKTKSTQSSTQYCVDTNITRTGKVQSRTIHFSFDVSSNGLRAFATTYTLNTYGSSSGGTLETWGIYLVAVYEIIE